MSSPSRIPPPPVSFSELGLSAPMLRTLAEVGYSDPTPIQALTLPVALFRPRLCRPGPHRFGEDGCLRRAHLGAPRPQLQTCRRWSSAPPENWPPRLQSSSRSWLEAAREILTVVGGDPIRRQLDGLLHPQVVVGTPGRVLDHLQRDTLSLKGIRFAVLDEADRMLDMGFAPDVERILLQTSKERQTMLFSPPPFRSGSTASPPATCGTLRPCRSAVEPSSFPRCAEWCIECSWSEKEEALGMLMDSPLVTLGLIFSNTKRNADHLHTALLARGYDVTVIHGDLSQRERDQALERFRGSRVRFLIATDVAARGINVLNDISHVVNTTFRAPDYVHRVGRTARAGRDGVALTLITPIEILKIRDIERHTKRPIEHHTLEDLKLLAGTADALVG